MNKFVSSVAVLLLAFALPAGVAEDSPPIALASRLELFVDHHLIDRMAGDARLVLHEPIDEGPVFHFDKPWEGPYCGYFTVIRDGGRYLLYYRGKPGMVKDGIGEVTCYAQSTDGVHWTRPSLGLHAIHGSTDNNVIWAPDSMETVDRLKITHNFSPMLDTNPDAAPDARFKALAGTGGATGLYALASADGIHWRLMRDEPVLTYESYAFDSQNLAFWSEAERAYVAYARLWVKSDDPGAPIPHERHGIRTVGRAESSDFLDWTDLQPMSYSDTRSQVPSTHLYTSQTHPYPRAPHIYLAVAARFMPQRQVLTDEQAQAIGVDSRYFKDTSDVVLLTSRGGHVYDRAFLGAFVRPGIGARNWVSRTNYPALNIVQTSPTELSLYANCDYAQPTAHLRRYSLRLDGFASVRAGFSGGELLTKPVTFTGERLLLNFATSAAGSVRVELQDAGGTPIPGYSLDDSVELIGNEIKRAARWTSGESVAELAGRPVRLRFVLQDADVYALRFAAGDAE